MLRSQIIEIKTQIYNLKKEKMIKGNFFIDKKSSEEQN